MGSVLFVASIYIWYSHCCCLAVQQQHSCMNHVSGPCMHWAWIWLHSLVFKPSEELWKHSSCRIRSIPRILCILMSGIEVATVVGNGYGTSIAPLSSPLIPGFCHISFVFVLSFLSYRQRWMQNPLTRASIFTFKCLFCLFANATRMRFI